ncbi:MAG: tyrosine-protein phosphatase [Pseudomonadota bacterium]
MVGVGHFLVAGTLAAALLSGPTATLANDRTVDLDGVKNTRDLGGLTTVDGRAIRPGLLIRSGEIDHITDDGKATLDAMGVASVIDMRTTKEATKAPASWPEGAGPARYNAPLMEEKSALIDDMRSRIASATAKADWMDQSFHDAFGSIPMENSESLREVFDILADPSQTDPVLFHCSGGKDRTGVVTALLLTALGVPREQIEQDFLLSNSAIDADAAALAFAEKINAENGTSMTAEDVWPSLGVRPGYLDHFYTTVEGEYGSVDDYLAQALQLSAKDIAILKDKYLE